MEPPAVGRFLPVAGLGEPRRGAAAVRLLDGRVLMVGGHGPGGVLATAELYQPDGAAARGAWTRTGSLSTGRYLPTATLLADGRVLVAGGLDAGGAYLASAELYEPLRGTFTPTGSLVAPRYLATAVRLPDGRVLLAGGYDGAALGAAELFDPAARGGAGSFSRTGDLSTGRAYATATLLADGRVLVVGGQGRGGAVLASAELFDPRLAAGAGGFTPTGALAAPRCLAAAALLADGRVLVAGGQDWSEALASVELFDPAADAGRGAFLPGGALGARRTVATATRLSTGEVLVAGGFDGHGVLASAELFSPSDGRFVPAAPLGAARYLATATWLPGDRVLLAGGQGAQELASAELFDRAPRPDLPPSKPSAPSP